MKKSKFTEEQRAPTPGRCSFAPFMVSSSPEAVALSSSCLRPGCGARQSTSV
jgi:hypothetical protein